MDSAPTCKDCLQDQLHAGIAGGCTAPVYEAPPCDRCGALRRAALIRQDHAGLPARTPRIRHPAAGTGWPGLFRS